MKKVILGFLMILISLINSLFLSKNMFNSMLCIAGGFLFITGALQMLDKFKENDHD